MINFHCTIISVAVLDVITHTSTWFLDREIHQLVKITIFDIKINASVTLVITKWVGIQLLMYADSKIFTKY